MVEEDDEVDDDDAYALDDYDYDHDYDEWDDDGDEEDDDYDDDQVAYVDDDGYFYADQETIDAVDQELAWDDEEMSNIVISYLDARNALAQARIARGFLPSGCPCCLWHSTTFWP